MENFRTKMRNTVYVGEGVTLNDAVRARDCVVVDGAVNGDIECAYLVVGAKGVVNGRVSVAMADIHGAVGPRLRVMRSLNVFATGRVLGEVAYGELSIEKGGVLDRARLKPQRAANGSVVPFSAIFAGYATNGDRRSAH